MKKANTNFDQRIDLKDDRGIFIECVGSVKTGMKGFCRRMEVYCRRIGCMAAEGK